MNTTKAIAALICTQIVVASACTGAWLQDQGETYYITSAKCNTKVVGKVSVLLADRQDSKGDSYSIYKAISSKSMKGMKVYNVSTVLPKAGMKVYTLDNKVVQIISVNSEGVSKLSKVLPMGTVLLHNGEAIGLSQGTRGMQVIPLSI
jgi:hypothetical protein